MRILWVATKPPVPSIDGGRLVSVATIAALRAAGHEIVVVAPLPPAAREDVARACADAGLRVELVAAAPPSWARAALAGFRSGVPTTIARHTYPAVRARVAEILATTRIDVVHAEQLHALAACEPATARGIPVVLRGQNVESDLWRGGGLLRALEARRLARFEGAAVHTVAATVALTERDAARLRELAVESGARAARGSALDTRSGVPEAKRHASDAEVGATDAQSGARRTRTGAADVIGDARSAAAARGDGARAGGDAGGASVRSAAAPVVRRVAAPFDPRDLAPGAPVGGAPAIVLPGSGGWPPNDEAAAWFVRAAWPVVRARLPGARLHRFGRAARGDERAGITTHAPPVASAALFPADAIVVVPLRRAAGIRMRILEAWARGVPVVATPAAAAGLDPGADAALALAATPTELAAAFARLAGDEAARAALVAAGRAFLARHHDPAAIARELADVYAEAVAASARRART